MKSLFVIIIALATITSNAQNWPIDKEANKIVFTSIITVDSATKNELYLCVKEWYAKTYNDSKSVIKLDDKETGKIVGKGLIQVIYCSSCTRPAGYVHYTFTIEVKDYKYKYTLCDIYHEGGNGIGSGGDLLNETAECGKYYLPNKNFKDIKQQAYDSIVTLINSLNVYVKSNVYAKETW